MEAVMNTPLAQLVGWALKILCGLMLFTTGELKAQTLDPPE